MTTVERANALIAAGDIATARHVLEDDAGRDADAAMTLAVWHLVGDHVPRDLVRARKYLRTAVEIGHVDAALMEIALTANGSGGPEDWPAAIALLKIAAREDPIAAQQLDLLQAMAIDDRGDPLELPAGETLGADPLLLRIPKLFTPAECAHVATAAAELLAPATVVDPRTGRHIADPIRTAHDAILGPTREDLVIRALNRRIAAASETRIAQGESLTVMRYTPGQQYRAHLDTVAGLANQRVKTAIVYLNQGYRGGETVFPQLNVTVSPGGGDAIVFDNTREDGSPNPRSVHAGMPVTEGAKWIATRWIRGADLDPWTVASG